MSGPVSIVSNVEASLSSVDRTRSLDLTSFIDKQRLSTSTNGEVPQSFSGARGYTVRDISLSNGDSYFGQLHGNLPEGFGKYVWSDGRVYEGNWRRGMRHGIGKISWPSGTIYEGEFSGGYIHGEGTYMLFEKLTYKGRWKLNLKHGLGYQSYANGDVFEGSWMQGLSEGPGKYSWANGNVYMGNIKGGKMSGKGTLTWSNGDSFEGNWLNGMMDGFGVYTWNDGGSYVGTWTLGLKDGKGSFYPKGSRVPAAQEHYLKAMRKRGLLPDMKKQNQAHIHQSSSMDIGNVKFGGAWNSSQNLEQSRYRNVSLERRWSMEVSIEKVIGHGPSLGLSESLLDDLDEDSERSIPILEREYMQGVLINELVWDNKFSPSSRRATRRQKKLVREAKRMGEAIIKGHRSYDLMLSLQLGIRYTVGKITPIQRRVVRASDFGSRASFWMNFPKSGSQLTPPHLSDDFRWKDYCPMVFRSAWPKPMIREVTIHGPSWKNLREMFKIDAADYMISICGNDTLRELSSPGKSGSVFFLSQDDRFMIKTLRKSEVKVLLRMLPKYYHHVQSYDNTLITKFFGLHRIKPSSGQKFRFVVMGNMFCTELRIHRRFDLKGSSLGRSADKVEIDENTILKDLDLNYAFYLEPSWREALMRQIEIDALFLEIENIMDYSLLLGVHYRAPQNLRPVRSSSQRLPADGLEILAEDDTLDDENYPQGLVLVPRGSNDGGSVVVGSHIRGSRLRTSSASGNEEVDLLLPGTARLQIQLGVNMPARADQIPGKEDKEMYHQVYDVVLYFGIIDILQEYNMSKKIEHAYKSLQFDSFSVSAVDPTFYSERFRKFMLKVFPPSAAEAN